MQKIFPAIRVLNLPKIPSSIINNLNTDFNSYTDIWALASKENMPIYRMTESHSEVLNIWAKSNICSDIDWGFQIISRDTDIHQDHRPYGDDVITGFPKIKFVYQLQLGGQDVKTEIYNRDADNNFVLCETHKLVLHKWYIFNTERYHRVIGIEPNNKRFAIIGHIF